MTALLSIRCLWSQFLVRLLEAVGCKVSKVRYQRLA